MRSTYKAPGRVLMTNTDLPAGWGFPTSTARKEHWFAEGSPRSGCGGYGRFLPFGINPDPPLPQEACKDCLRKAAHRPAPDKPATPEETA